MLPTSLPDARVLLGALALTAAGPALAADDASDAQDDCAASSSEDAPEVLPGRLFAAAFRDTRGFSTLSLQTFLVLPRGLSVFGFVDLDNKYADMPAADSSQAYSELNLFWGRYGTVPVSLHAQWALGTSPLVTDRVRLGARVHAPPATPLGGWLADQDLMVTLTWFPVVQTLDLAPPSSWETQVGFFYRWRPLAHLLDGRLELVGWGDVDLFIGSTTKSSFITEHQIGVRVWGPLSVVTELRHASFEPEQRGVGVGLQLESRVGVPTRR